MVYAVCVWLFKLDNPLPLLIGSGIAALVVLTEASRWAFGHTKAA